jgi:hypothetical protein
MANWKKVVVSGSAPQFSNIQVDGVSSGQVLIGGGSAGNVTGQAINGTGNIVATSAATLLSHSGSFSGSFKGDFVGVISGSVSTSTTSSTFITTDNTTGVGPYYMVFVAGTSGAQSALVDSTGMTYNATTNTLSASSSYAFSATSASYSNNATSASYALSSSIAGRVPNSLTLGNGLSGNAYDGSGAITAAVGAGTLISVGADVTNVATESIALHQIVKYGNGFLSGSNISDTGTQVQIGAGATAGLSVAAGGVNVTGNSIFNNNLTVTGDLAVNGTTTFINTTNLQIKDQFVMLASGSTALTEAGIIAQYNAAGSGSAFYLESTGTSTYGRWALAFDIVGANTSIVADEYLVSAKVNQASDPSAAPVWGGASTGTGNLWITNAGDIFIYA